MREVAALKPSYIPCAQPVEVESSDLGNDERHLVAILHWHPIPVNDFIRSQARRSYTDRLSGSFGEFRGWPCSGIFVHAGMVLTLKVP